MHGGNKCIHDLQQGAAVACSMQRHPITWLSGDALNTPYSTVTHNHMAESIRMAIDLAAPCPRDAIYSAFYLASAWPQLCPQQVCAQM